MLTKLYGKTRGKLNTRAAADELGVSQRSVQRWIKDRKLPASVGGEQLKAQHEAWKATPKGRVSALGRKRRDELLDTRRISFTGKLRISRDVRKRTNMQIEGFNRDQMQGLVDRLAAGDDPGAHRSLEDLISSSANWGGDVEIRIENITFD